MLYTVDGFSTYAEGCRVELRAAGELLGRGVPEDLVAAADDVLTGGVAQHGRAALIDAPAYPGAEDDAWAELLLELTRRAHAPDRPSRLQALFAFEDLEDARAFRANYRPPDAPIYEVEPAGAARHRGDARLLGRAHSALVGAIYARWYWEGRTNVLEPPLWEVLLPLPQTIGRRID